jgi:hypothetical protein
VDDADIAGTRTTLQPAHHLTNFVPAPDGHILRAFRGLLGARRVECALLRDQNVSIDPDSVIERHSRRSGVRVGWSGADAVTIGAVKRFVLQSWFVQGWFGAIRGTVQPRVGG